MITDPFDDATRSFARRCTFEDIPSEPRRAMIMSLADLDEPSIRR